MGGRSVKPVHGEGPQDADGVLVGESPGLEETDQGRPFVGSTGAELDIILAAFKIRRARLYVVNAIACRPPANKTEPMMRLAARCCRPAFWRQVAGLRTDHFLAMGKWAYFACTGKDKGVMAARGFLRHTWTKAVIRKLVDTEVFK